jgi:hypothetical protein
MGLCYISAASIGGLEMRLGRTRDRVADRGRLTRYPSPMGGENPAGARTDGPP